MISTKTVRFAIRVAAQIWAFAVVVAVPSYVNSKEVFILFGEGMSSCGEFLRSADAERKRRPANASPTAIYDMNFAAFSSFADGFLVGTNYSIEAQVGEHTDQNGRMVWLENYCRNHPLDT